MPRKSTATPSVVPNQFLPGDTVEISLYEPGFRGSLYTATIVRLDTKKRDAEAKYVVDYKNLMADEAGTKPLREIIDWKDIRPVPPRETDREFKIDEEVDAYYNDGWWEGIIVEAAPNGKFAVFFKGTREQIEFTKDKLRLHREWVNGSWVPPLQGGGEEEEEKKVSTIEEVKSSEAMTMFSNGTVVEVSSDEDGFEGAWFSGTIIKAVGKDTFLVEYKHLKTDDGKRPLREKIDTLHIRPCPPETLMVDGFNLHDEVDALHNDGWWVGVISKVLKGSKYRVYFRGTKEDIVFEHSDLRLHQDWINGKWVMASSIPDFEVVNGRGRKRGLSSVPPVLLRR